MSTEHTAGSVIAGRYRLTSQLGRGGMGSVWRAEDLSLGSPVALKLLAPELAADEGVRARFLQEAKAAAALRSPHVVHIIEHGVDRGVPFITMELLEGETLAGRLARVNVLPYAETSRILSDVARAVRRAHEGSIVHRDLKPENIFLVRNDDQELAKVLDFGIAKAMPLGNAQSRSTKTGTLIGTPPYMSPEQARGEKIDHRTDLWALGVIAFECVCGRLPFLAEAPGALILQICSEPIPVPSEVARVPPGFDAWFARATERDANRRFQSAKEMVDALKVILSPGTASEPVSAAVPMPLPTGALASKAAVRAETMSGKANFESGFDAPRPRRTARVGAISGAAVLLVVAAAAVWRLSGNDSVPPAASGTAPAVPVVTAAPDIPAGPVVTPATVAAPAEPAPSAAAVVEPPKAPPAAPAPPSAPVPTGETPRPPVLPVAKAGAGKPPNPARVPPPNNKKKAEDRIGF